LNVDVTEAFVRLGTALAIGLFIGLQREYSKHSKGGDRFAGARTFALIALVGALGALVDSASDGGFLVAGLLLAVGSFSLVAYYQGTRSGEVGMTTEMAVLVVFVTGAAAGYGMIQVAVGVGVATATILAIKPWTRSLVASIHQEDISASLQFAILAALVLPLLPDEPMGPEPFNAATPFSVGLMVVFISGLSLIGYILIQVVGARRGVGLTGILGGLVSSTAVTLTLSERSKGATGLGRPLALGLVLAWTIMFVRVLIEVQAVNADLLGEVIVPVGAAVLISIGWAAFLYWRGRDKDRPEADMGTFSNPFRLGPAIQFGLLYGVILIASKAASMYFGDQGVYLSAFVSGVADVDAITLSMANLSRGDGSIADPVAGKAIAIAAATNTLVKGGIVWTIGRGSIRPAVTPAFIGSAVVCVGLAFLH
jgi:uncharacterized membrane protein (DUF4010 family)